MEQPEKRRKLSSTLSKKERVDWKGNPQLEQKTIELYKQGLKPIEIASQLGIPVTAVRSKMASIRKDFPELLKSKFSIILSLYVNINS